MKRQVTLPPANSATNGDQAFKHLCLWESFSYKPPYPVKPDPWFFFSSLTFGIKPTVFGMPGKPSTHELQLSPSQKCPDKDKQTWSPDVPCFLKGITYKVTVTRPVRCWPGSRHTACTVENPETNPRGYNQLIFVQELRVEEKVVSTESVPSASTILKNHFKTGKTLRRKQEEISWPRPGKSMISWMSLPKCQK